jgi:hypothetical protein
MSRDGSGTYSLPATMAPASTQSSSTTVNNIMTDVAAALTDSINKDGTKAMAADWSMGTNKITGLKAGTALTDAANLSQVQKGSVAWATTVGGTVDAITLAFTPAITSYTTGMRVRWASAGTNTSTTPTMNIDGLGVKTITRNLSTGTGALAAGTIGAAGFITEAVYDGTNMVLVNGLTDASAGTPEASIAEWRANTADRLLTTDIVYSAAELVTLTDAATIAVDMDTGFNFTLTIGGNRTLGLPTNLAVGKSGFIRIIQDGSGSKTLAYHASWKFNGGTDPTLTTTANAIDILYYTVIATDFIHASLNKDVK